MCNITSVSKARQKPDDREVHCQSMSSRYEKEAIPMEPQ